MELGHLKIQKIDLSKHYVQDPMISLFTLYSKLIDENGKFSFIVEKFKNDERMKLLDGKLISNGMGGFGVDVKRFSMWYLWLSNEIGEYEANKAISSFFESDKVKIYNTLWVQGIETDDIIELDGGIKIIPLDLMPDSREKTEFQKVDPNMRTIKPKAALVSECEIQKIIETNNDFKNTVDANFKKSSEELYSLSHILNLIHEVYCRPYFHTTYYNSDFPLGPFSSSGGSSPIYDIEGTINYKINSSITSQINSLMSSFTKLSKIDYIRYTRILSRISQAKRRQQVEDQVLDLGISLEMALLADNNNRNQLNLTFRLRGSWLASSNAIEREKYFKVLNDLYKLRSEVAHTGIIKDTEKASSKVPEFFSLTIKILRLLVLNGEPNWDQLILGID